MSPLSQAETLYKLGHITEAEYLEELDAFNDRADADWERRAAGATSCRDLIALTIADHLALIRASRCRADALWQQYYDELIDELQDELEELGELEELDCPPLDPLPKSSTDEVAAIKAQLAANAPKAHFYEDDGLWLRYPSANRMVRAGDPRDGDVKPRFEELALHQASHRATRKRRKGGRRG